MGAEAGQHVGTAAVDAADGWGAVEGDQPCIAGLPNLLQLALLAEQHPDRGTHDAAGA